MARPRLFSRPAVFRATIRWTHSNYHRYNPPCEYRPGNRTDWSETHFRTGTQLFTTGFQNGPAAASGPFFPCEGNVVTAVTGTIETLRISVGHAWKRTVFEFAFDPPAPLECPYHAKTQTIPAPAGPGAGITTGRPLPPQPTRVSNQCRTRALPGRISAMKFSHSSPVPIAVVGMGCRMPGAENLDEYWSLISEGRSAIGRLPDDRLDRALYFDPGQRGQQGKSYSELGASSPTGRSIRPSVRCPRT